MTSIIRATEKDCTTIAMIGRISVRDAHQESCSEQDMDDYLEKNYNDTALRKELNDPGNIYHIIYYNDEPVGFSKIVLNAWHANITEKNATKVDRIYLLKEYHALKLGYELLKFNLDYAKENNQSGIWLFTWTGNSKAVNFYLRAGFSIIGMHRFKVSETHYNPNHQMFYHL